MLTQGLLGEVTSKGSTEPNYPSLGNGGRGTLPNLAAQIGVDSTAGDNNGPTTENTGSKLDPVVVNRPYVGSSLCPLASVLTLLRHQAAPPLPSNNFNTASTWMHLRDTVRMV